MPLTLWEPGVGLTQTPFEHFRDLKTLESHLLSRETEFSAATPLARTAWKVTETGGEELMEEGLILRCH